MWSKGLQNVTFTRPTRHSPGCCIVPEHVRGNGLLQFRVASSIGARVPDGFIAKVLAIGAARACWE